MQSNSRMTKTSSIFATASLPSQVLDPSIYLCAKDALVDAHVADRIWIKHMIDVGDIPPSGSSVQVEPELAWTSGEWVRQQAYLEAARLRGYVDEHMRNSTAAACIVDLSQTFAYSKLVDTKAMPTLLRHSHMADLARRRNVLLPELFLVQG